MIKEGNFSPGTDNFPHFPPYILMRWKMVFETLSQFLSKLMFFHGYVNEYNGFPKPLSKEDEEKYVDLMMKGDKKARETLINHNMRLVAHVAKNIMELPRLTNCFLLAQLGLLRALTVLSQKKARNFLHT